MQGRGSAQQAARIGNRRKESSLGEAVFVQCTEVDLFASYRHESKSKGLQS